MKTLDMQASRRQFIQQLGLGNCLVRTGHERAIGIRQ